MFRGMWMHARTRELPHYCVFLYNVLLDPGLRWDLKEAPFATLSYLFIDNTILPNEDPLLGHVDDVTMVICALRDMIGRLPEGSLAKYDQILSASGIRMLQVVPEAPQMLGAFLDELTKLHKELLRRFRPFLGNAIMTGSLVKELQKYLTDFREPSWSQADVEKVHKFLSSFSMPGEPGRPGGGPPAPAPAAQPASAPAPA